MLSLLRVADFVRLAHLLSLATNLVFRSKLSFYHPLKTDFLGRR